MATWGAKETAENDLFLSLGMAHRQGNQYVLERHYATGLADAANNSRLFEDYIAHTRYNAKARASARVSAWNSDGVALYTTNDAFNSSALILAEKFGDVGSRVALVDSAVTTGNTDYTLDWDPQYVEQFVSAKQGVGATTDDQKAGTIGVHTVTDDGEFSNEVSGENGAATTNEQSLSDNQFIVVGHTGTTLAAGATTLGTAKYTINYATAPATALKMISLAVEEGQAAGGGGDYITAAFSVDVVDGIAPFRVQFTDLSAGTNTITSWAWDFGDGATSTSQNPTHIYTSPGTFTVSLTVSDGTLSDTEEAADLITSVEVVKRRVIFGPYILKYITEDSRPVTHRDPDETDAGYMEGGLSLGAIRLSADPAVPVALPDEVSVYMDAASGDLKVKYVDDTDGTVDVT